MFYFSLQKSTLENTWFLGTGKGREEVIKSGVSGEIVTFPWLALELYLQGRNEAFPTGPPMCV